MQKPQVITIDGVEYNSEDFTEKQSMLVNHVADLEHKLASTRFQLDQLQVARDAFFMLLKQELAAEKQESKEAEEDKETE